MFGFGKKKKLFLLNGVMCKSRKSPDDLQFLLDTILMRSCLVSFTRFMFEKVPPHPPFYLQDFGIFIKNKSSEHWAETRPKATFLFRDNAIRFGIYCSMAVWWTTLGATQSGSWLAPPPDAAISVETQAVKYTAKEELISHKSDWKTDFSTCWHPGTQDRRLGVLWPSSQQ